MGLAAFKFEVDSQSTNRSSKNTHFFPGLQPGISPALTFRRKHSELIFKKSAASSSVSV